MNFIEEPCYVMDELEKGERSLKMLFYSHNAYWGYVRRLDREFNNCSVDIFGRTNIRDAVDIEIADYDLLLYYSSSSYEEREFNEMKTIALQISANKKKRVTIGHAYVIPREDKEIRILSCKDGVESEKIQRGEPSVSDLINIALKFHDKLEQ